MAITLPFAALALDDPPGEAAKASSLAGLSLRQLRQKQSENTGGGQSLKGAGSAPSLSAVSPGTTGHAGGKKTLPAPASPDPRRPVQVFWPLTLLAALAGWQLALSILRISYCAVGRAFGFAAPERAAAFLHWGIPWRPVYKRYDRFLWWLRQVRISTDANAGWASLPAVMVNVFKSGESVPIGRLVYKGIKLFQTLAYRGSLHVNVIGPSGSGKTATFITWLGTLHRKGAAFFVDCDAQIINAIGDWLVSTGHTVICLDPNHLSRFTRGGWNALAEFTAAEKRHGRKAVPNFAKELGNGLVRQENFHQPTFDNGGRDFLVALCLFVWLTAPEEKKHLTYVRHLLCCGLPPADPKEDPFDVLLFEMAEMEYYNDQCEGKIGALIARGAATMRSGQNQSGGNPFRGSAMRATSWLDIPRLAELSERSDFVCEELKTSNLCVAIVAPLTDIKGTYSGWVRALTVMTAYAFQNIPGSLKIPTAMLIDEAPSLGRLELLEIGSPGFRKYGIRLVLGLQDLPAISAKTAYPDTYASFFSNAGINLWMGANELQTLRYITETLGKHTCKEQVEGTPWYLFWLPRRFKTSHRYQNVERLLKDPSQVKDALLPEHGMMIVTGKTRPFIAAIDPYWKALPVSRYNPDPSYGETFFRASTRRVLAKWQARTNKVERRSDPQ